MASTSARIAAMVVLAGGALAAFVYGYPRIFPVIEQHHPDNYLERMAELATQGSHAQATRVAAQAARQRPYDPEPWSYLASLRWAQRDPDGARAAAEHAIAIEQTMDGIPTRRTRYHDGARMTLMTLALEANDLAAAAGHLEFARRFSVWPAEAWALHYERLDLPVRAAALRGEWAGIGGSPLEWVELDDFHSHRPWAPCQLQQVRLGLYDDGRVDLEWVWTQHGEPLAPETIPTRMNEVPIEMLGRLEAVTLGEDAPDALPLALPGFQTTAHLWHEGSRVALEQGGGPAIVLERDGGPGNAMLNTLPVRADGGMLVAVRLRAEGSPASITWLAEDALEQESFRDTFAPVPPGEWTWRARYHPASHHWDAAWLQVGIFNGTGRVTIDRVVMLTLPEAPACAE